jgi:hypothetical protein
MATPSETPSTSGSARNTLPLIAIAAIVVIGLVLYLIGRGSNTGGKSGDAPQPASLPQGRGASMARNTGKTIVLSAPRVTKIAAGGELGAGQTGWAFDLAYTWKEELDPKMSFRAPYKMPKPNVPRLAPFLQQLRGQAKQTVAAKPAIPLQIRRRRRHPVKQVIRCFYFRARAEEFAC